ncbi:putative transcription factor Rap1 [Aspergillus homomorphus CBS 101889]|uniref:DNA-binding protein RAP1 n=1 Tax=Aspergillus homomorphus (strain CBS 101889) TaxID=1450537 RepID=A0A395I8Q2_ASPHC|nr:hypothetical protein BO97DRAFT_336423 [Aspergillus homomorphus CBS 101889]RAL16376.1 hypothetical protein BO97DRAFT_336423 [Aspergillus homomorphus CBS 101889]
MAETHTVASHGGASVAGGTLFRGKHFWLSQNVPQRNRFKELIERYGGSIRLFEKDADIKLVDHKRRNLPADTYSFRFVEDSIRQGRMQSLEAYRAGPSEARPVGASYIPTRSHKVPYTIADDQLLWDWVQKYERDPDASISGNKIYQELAAKNPRHTFQSYRDRYLKRLRGRPRPGGMPKGPTQQETVSQEAAPAQSTSPITQPRPQTRLSQKPEEAPSSSKPADRKRKRTSDSSTQSEETDETHRPASKRMAAEHVPEGQEGTDVSPQNKGKEPVRPQQPLNSTISQIPPEIDSLFLELPFLPSSPEPEPEPEPQTDLPEQDIDTWINGRLRAGKATEEQIIEALRCTSMDPHLADKVLEFLTAGKGIPDDMPGVWTPGDDKCVEGTETRGVQRVLEKHGAEAFDARWEYLSMARAAGLETEAVE